MTFPTGQNLTKCGVTCDETSETLNVEKLCAKEQCKVESQPPVTEPSTPFVFFPCLFCGGGGGGDDDDGSDGPGDDGDGSSSNFPLIPPIIPFLPPLLPFFPPIVPIIAGTGPGGGGGGPGSGVKPTPGPGSPPPIPVPIIITVPPGAPEPITAGGTVLPGTNFTQTPVYCGNATHRQIVVDQSTLPELMYICMLTANGTYAWVPHCPCNGAAANATVWYYNTSVLYQQGSTLYVSNSSQMIVEGATYLGGPVYVGGEVTFNSTASFCPTTGNGTSLKANRIESCTNGPVDFPEGISIGGVPLVPSNTTAIFNNGSVLLTNGSTLYISNSSTFITDGSSTFNGPTTFTTPVTLVDVTVSNSFAFCPAGSQVARFKQIGGCGGPLLVTANGLLTLNATQVQVLATSLVALALEATEGRFGDIISNDLIGSRVNFPNGLQSCSVPIVANTFSSCDGISRVVIAPGVETPVVTTERINSTTPIVISGPSVSIVAPSGVAMDTLSVLDIYVGEVRQIDNIGLPVPFPDGISTPLQTVGAQTVTTQTVSSQTISTETISGSAPILYSDNTTTSLVINPGAFCTGGTLLAARVTPGGGYAEFLSGNSGCASGLQFSVQVTPSAACPNRMVCMIGRYSTNPPIESINDNPKFYKVLLGRELTGFAIWSELAPLFSQRYNFDWTCTCT